MLRDLSELLQCLFIQNLTEINLILIFRIITSLSWLFHLEKESLRIIHWKKKYQLVRLKLFIPPRNKFMLSLHSYNFSSFEKFFKLDS